MIRLEGGGTLLEDASELPRVPDRVRVLYADFETSSGDPALDSLDPWRHCTAIGAAVAFDGGPAWFVPRGLLATGWWAEACRAAVCWQNHNVKYDAHISKNDLGVAPPPELSCSVAGWKMVDSDRLGYGLDSLSRELFGADGGKRTWALAPYLHRCKDFGAVPLPVLAEYACRDLELARRLGAEVEARMPAESQGCWATERRVTRLLWEMEQTGVRVDPTQLKVVTYRTLARLLDLDARMEELAGRPFRAHVNEDCHDVLCTQHGLPVLAWTDPQERKDGTVGVPGPSFDKDALKLYLDHVDAPRELVQCMLDYRRLHTFKTLFLDCWDELHVGGVMHPTHNQTVRTGRMSASRPNTQQLSEEAKAMVVPPPGCAIVTADFSQIEFRFIAHYIENPRWVEAYCKDPWTDAHDWVSGMAGIPRKPAKTMNFRIAFGGGKKNVVAALSVEREVVGELRAAVEALGLEPSHAREEVLRRCRARGEQLYATYHGALPELKPTARAAERACRTRGYVRNHYGRRRRLPPEHAHKAFNNLNQSSAADLMKERLVAVRDEVPELALAAVVHDSVVGTCPLELVEAGPESELLLRLTRVMNSPSRPLRVPIRTAVGWSARSWADADARQFKPHR